VLSFFLHATTDVGRCFFGCLRTAFALISDEDEYASRS